MGCVGFFVGSVMEFNYSSKALFKGESVHATQHGIFGMAKLLASAAEGVLCASELVASIPPTVVAAASAIVVPLCGGIAIGEGVRECWLSPDQQDKVLGVVNIAGGICLVAAACFPPVAAALISAGASILLGVLVCRFARWAWRKYQSSRSLQGAKLHTD